jgi:hypothetical protein
MADSLGDAAQTRKIVEQACEATAEIVLSKYVASHPPLPVQAEIPTPLKWAGGIAAVLLTTGIGGTTVWAMTTINEMQVTVARIDERLVGSASAQTSSDDENRRRFEEINGRLTRLEQIAGAEK